jgi:hypothetical protein
MESSILTTEASAFWAIITRNVCEISVEIYNYQGKICTGVLIPVPDLSLGIRRLFPVPQLSEGMRCMARPYTLAKGTNEAARPCTLAKERNEVARPCTLANRRNEVHGSSLYLS